MVRKLEALALIPARGGSRGILRKNIKPFSGFPLMAWSIAAAKQAQLVTRTIVSTDDKEMARVAREFGAEVPFMRPARLAQDDTLDLPVFIHALKWLARYEKYQPDIIVQLRPTSPIRPRGLVDRAIEILMNNPKAHSVRGVIPAGQNPHKMWRVIDENNSMKNLLDVDGVDEPYNSPRQHLPQIYWQTGHIDAIRREVILSGSMSGKSVYPIHIDPRFSVDLDNHHDWARYEFTVGNLGLDMVWVHKKRRKKPKTIKLIVSDFDGVITDNRVWVNQTGEEMVACSRSDSLLLGELKEKGIEFIILSSEKNPVVAARAKKMKVECIQGIHIKGKGEMLKKLIRQKKLNAKNVIYVGNDINDLPCFDVVAWGVAVADAYPEVLKSADHVLTKNGGNGAIRELCELVLGLVRST